MLRVKTSLIKKTVCALMVIALSVPMVVTGHAADDDVLYFGALDESIAQNVKTTVVEKGTFFTSGLVQGNLDFTSNQWVFSDISEGTVTFQSFVISQGSIVKKGDPLVEVKVTVDEVEKEEVEMNLAAAKRNLEEYVADTKLLLSQYKAATETGSESDRQLAELSYTRLLKTFNDEVENREAKIDNYTLRLDEIEDLENTKYINAPSDGIIGYLGRFRKGEVITGWSFLCIINDPEKVRVVVEGGSDTLRYNMPVKIIQRTGNRNVELTGRVLTMKSTASSVNLIARDDIIEIYGDKSKLMPGSQVTIKFDKTYVEDAVMVKKSAIKTDKKGSYVNVFVNGFSTKRYVIIGGSDADRSWIISGVDEGDIVILE